MIARFVVALGVASFLIAPAAQGQYPSDAERLLDGLPAGFKRPEVAIYPLFDQRHLTLDAAEGPNTASIPPPGAWISFVEAMTQFGNLHVRLPDETIRLIQANQIYEITLPLANTAAHRAYGDYREVRLDLAVSELRDVAETYRSIEHDVVRPRDVARAELTRGLALLEMGNRSTALLAFRDALLTDPTLRPRAGYDRPATTEVFEEARSTLLDRAPPEPAGFAGQRKGLVSADAVVIRGRAFGDRIELTVELPNAGVIRDFAIAGDDPVDAGRRLAARVWSCLPFGEAPRDKRHRPHLYLDAGFTYFVYASAPGDGLFSNFGASANVSWVFAPQISLDASLAVTNSNRDRSEDLRADIATIRSAFGPGFLIRTGRWGFFGRAGFEVASPSRVVTTTNANCKFFTEADRVPPEICDYETQVDEVDRTLMIGAALSVGISLRLYDKIYTAVRIHGAEYFFESDDIELDYPTGVDLGLGYRF